MILDVQKDNLNKIKNPALRSYAGIYVEIYQDFLQQIAETGIKIASKDNFEEARNRIARLVEAGAVLSNNDHSIYINEISPACVACQTGVGSATYFISLQCHRDCYFCFNPNQEEYDYYQLNTRDVIEELEQVKRNQQQIRHLALTGGEPLLHKEKALEIFDYARHNFPEVYTRLYTSGDHADDETLQELRDAGLQEIRFSIRMHDLAADHRLTYERIALAKKYIPFVMVEMPVLPGTLEEMKEVLLELDRLSIYSINLLELCFPFDNVDEFNQRGFEVKKRPF